MRFVPIKTVEQQAACMVLKTRDLLVRQRSQVANAFRAHMSEIGVIASAGMANIEKLAEMVRNPATALPDLARRSLLELVEQLDDLSKRIGRLDDDIRAGLKTDEAAIRLTSIPGVGPLIAATIRATVPNPGGFLRGRDFAAN